jgi:high-affinity Fe2+/Pb2+ permease
MAEPPSDDQRQRKNIAGVLAALVVLGLIVWLVHALHKNLEMEKCLEEGRRDCVDLPQPEN